MSEAMEVEDIDEDMTISMASDMTTPREHDVGQQQEQFAPRPSDPKRMGTDVVGLGRRGEPARGSVARRESLKPPAPKPLSRAKTMAPRMIGARRLQSAPTY